MKIELNSQYKIYAPLFKRLTDEQRKQAERDCVQALYGQGGLWNVELGSLIRAMQQDFSGLTQGRQPGEWTVGDYLIVSSFVEFVELFFKTLKSIKIPETKSERKAAVHAMKVTTAESLLCFVREYFGLHSFAEAEHITLSEVVIARRDVAAKKTFQLAQLS